MTLRRFNVEERGNFRTQFEIDHFGGKYCFAKQALEEIEKRDDEIDRLKKELVDAKFALGVALDQQRQPQGMTIDQALMNMAMQPVRVKE